MAYKVIIDAGHGGSDPGAVYKGRQEKDDTLALALAVGELLEENGIDVVYTRTDDVYDTPYEKAMIANNSGADYFISIHRNAVPTPNTASGVETLVYRDGGVAGDIARSINTAFRGIGFADRGVIERPNLVVLKRTKMPAVLVEAGFIDNDLDNEKFDEEFDSIAAAIANGILDSLKVDYRAVSVSAEPAYSEVEGNAEENINNASEELEWPDYRMNERRSFEPLPPVIGIPGRPLPQVVIKPESMTQGRLYRVQTGSFRVKEYADDLVAKLRADGFAPFVVYSDGLFRVQAGAFRQLDNAVKLEQRLRRLGYNTFITS